MAGNYNFEIDQGSTFEKSIIYYAEGMTPVDLTGYSARMQIRKNRLSSEPIVSIDTVTGGITITPLAGKIDIVISADDSKLITANCVYDLEIYSGEFVKRLIQGSIIFSGEVTR